jgi:pectin methylesterase-like acyl-CoA thioesterase
MKAFRTLLLCAAFACVAALAIPFVAGAAGNTLLNDTFADGNSQNQDLANNSLRIFNGRTTTTHADAVGSVTFDLTNTTSSDAFWGFFTNPGAPVSLGVGDKVSVSETFQLGPTFPATSGADIRYGVLDSKATRNAANPTGGMNDATFANDTGYGLQFFPSGSGAPFILYRRLGANLGNPNNPFNSMGTTDWAPLSGTGAGTRQTLAANTPYTMTYTVERQTATETRITVSVTGGALPANYSYTAVDSGPPALTTFDYFGFRVANNTFAKQVKFTNVRVDFSPALPIINSQPQPSNLTVQVGSNVTTSVGASGNALTYQWTKNDQPIQNNASATTPTLNLTNVQLSDAGVYKAVVTNPGGSVTSNPVTLNVSVDPVPPPPSVTTQPADTNATIGSPTSLSVAATGDGLFYQWFKNGALIPGATQAALNFPSAQVADSADYYVVVSNSSGSVTSSNAKLLVVSTMQATGFAPSNYASNVDVDAPLYLTFNQAPAAGTSGRIRVYSETGSLVDTIDLSAATQSRLNGSVTFNYRPVIVNGNTAAIYLHQKLAYNTSYYVTLEPGVVKDSNGAPFVGFSDTSVWNFSTKTSAPAAGATALTVAADGSGDFATVQGAVDFVPANNAKRVVILVKKGTYTEVVYVGSNKPFLTVRGEDRNESVIQYANNNTFNPTSTTTRAMFGVDAADFALENITLRNTTPKGGSQAEAFRGNNNRIVLNKVSLYSFQDTLLLQSPTNQGGFVTDSYIEGDVDFVWGAGTAFFQNTELKMLSSGAYLTQIRNPQGRNGNVFVNCKLTGASGATNSYLSRIDPGVFPYSQVVYINTQMQPSVYIPAGWLLNNATTAPNVQFWEYNSRDLSGNPVDVSQRAPFSRQLTAAEAAQWSDPAFVLGGWVPQTKLTAGVTLSNLAQSFNGSPAAVTVTTEPAGLPVNVTYNGGTTPPAAIGTYTVVATVNDPNYQGSATGTLVVDRTPVAVTLSNLVHTYDGTPKSATVTTNPAGPLVTLTYNGSAAPPTAAGTYSVVATINDPNYRGGTSATLNIYAPGTQPLAAFPGAEGAGANAKGGRGGDVYHVINLNDTGEGSLRYGISSATGPRTIVFDVAGTIYLTTRLNINKSFLTIAGQTAPGDGVTVAGHSAVVTGNNVVIRYLRFRMGDINCPAVQDDALWVDKTSDVIIDHVSASWSVDETLSVTESDRVSVQWSFITESMKNSCHVKGAHGYGSLIRYGAGQVTYHHNLYAHHDSRNPRVGDDIGLDFVNNIIYDWGAEATYSGPADEGSPRINYVGNYLVAGPMTASSKLRAFSSGGATTQIYQSNNLLDGDKDGTRDGVNNEWSMFIGSYVKREPARFEFAQVNTHDAATAYELVLKTAGSSLKRDSVDERVAGEVRSETGRHINSQNDVGGYPTLNPGPALNDADDDGIPDQWETTHGLNPTDPSDGPAVAAGGYTNLELYLNDLVPAPGIDPAADAVAPVTTATLSQPANDVGWHNSDVTLTLNAADNDGGSGLREIVYSVNGVFSHVYGTTANIPVTSEGTTNVVFYAKDQAGNTEAAQTVTVKLDKTAPVIRDVTRTAANANGWNNTDVVASYTATDSGSGFASGATLNDSLTFSNEGAGQSQTIEVKDLAGNTASQTVGNVNIDKTAPEVSVVRPAEGAFYAVGESVLADFACTDNLSGNAACVGTVEGASPLDTATVGAKTFTVSTTDEAGNQTAKTVGYTVGYRLEPLYEVDKVNKAGSTVPVKLQLLDNAGTNLSSADKVLHALGVGPDSSDTYGPAADAGNANPGGNFRFTGDGYVYNLKTTGYAPGTYRLYFTVGADPHVYTTQLQIK